MLSVGCRGGKRVQQHVGEHAALETVDVEAGVVDVARSAEGAEFGGVPAEFEDLAGAAAGEGLEEELPGEGFGVFGVKEKFSEGVQFFVARRHVFGAVLNSGDVAVVRAADGQGVEADVFGAGGPGKEVAEDPQFDFGGAMAGATADFGDHPVVVAIAGGDGDFLGVLGTEELDQAGELGFAGREFGTSARAATVVGAAGFVPEGGELGHGAGDFERVGGQAEGGQFVVGLFEVQLGAGGLGGDGGELALGAAAVDPEEAEEAAVGFLVEVLAEAAHRGMMDGGWWMVDYGFGGL